MKLFSIILGIYLVSTLASFSAAYAAGGAVVGNGGDICEDRFKIVRDDIASWIQKGGSAGLSLPNSITLAQYNTNMLTEIADAGISCVDREITVDGAEKTCENFLDPAGKTQIECNSTRFMATSASDQYVLVHHEYAGLAGFEVNNGEESQYAVSNQISGYLENQTVKKLAVKPTQASEVSLYDGLYVDPTGVVCPWQVETDASSGDLDVVFVGTATRPCAASPELYQYHRTSYNQFTDIDQEVVDQAWLDTCRPNSDTKMPCVSGLYNPASGKLIAELGDVFYESYTLTLINKNSFKNPTDEYFELKRGKNTILSWHAHGPNTLPVLFVRTSN
jgi:hypothetical protein